MPEPAERPIQETGFDRHFMTAFGVKMKWGLEPGVE
jgi:hypothetical protein